MSQLPSGVDPANVPLLPPPTGRISNFVNPPSLAPVAEGVGGTLVAIETLLLCLRTWSNFKTFSRLRFEDYWTILAVTLTYGYFALLMLFRPVARHEWDIPLTEATETLYKTMFAREMLLGPTRFFAKTSLLLLFYRIFSPDKWFRYKLYGAFIFIALTTLSAIPMYLAICLPDNGDSWAEAAKKCSKTSIYTYIPGPAAVAFDLFLIYLPASVVINLHMPLRRKIGVLAIFMTGMFALVASVIGLVYRIRFVHELDRTWASYIVEICLLIESCVSIICSCMPSIPVISFLIASNSYFATLRPWLVPPYTSSSKSKSTPGSFRRQVFPGKKGSEEHEPYVRLVDGCKDYIGTCSATQTKIQHVAQLDLPINSGINVSVELEVSSTRKDYTGV